MPTRAIILLVISLTGAAAPTSASDPIASSFRKTASAHARSMLAAAQAMPSREYGYSPTAEQRTFAQLVIHIEDDSRITCSAIAGVKAGPSPGLAVSDAKDRLIDALQTTLSFCDSALARVTDATLADSVIYYDASGLRVQALVGLVDDWADHYSQMAMYLRLNGILPPTAKRTASDASQHPDSGVIARDGQRDFDFELGRWAIEVKRLVHPLSGSSEWATPLGYTHLVRKVWNGQASLAELENDRPSTHFDGLMLRLYDPASHEWRIYWGSSRSGSLDAPLVGHFENGRGVFYQRDRYEDKPILVRLVYSDITSKSFHTESSFSADNGKSWEPNLVQKFVRLSK